MVPLGITRFSRAGDGGSGFLFDISGKWGYGLAGRRCRLLDFYRLKSRGTIRSWS